MEWVVLDGVLVPARTATLSVLDHGLLYGDGLFETVRVHRGKLFRPEAHLARLRGSAVEIALSIPWSDADLLDALGRTALANGVDVGAVRLTVTRGEGPPVPDPVLCMVPHYLVTSRPYTPPDQADWERGITLCVAGHHPRPGRPGIKSLSYLPFQEARRHARERGFDDGLLLHDGAVVETGISNVFAVISGTLVTPRTESGCLPGIARNTVLEIARSLGVKGSERTFTIGELRVAEEAFTTNALQGLTPVTLVDDSILSGASAGPITRQLAERYEALLEASQD